MDVTSLGNRVFAGVTGSAEIMVLHWDGPSIQWNGILLHRNWGLQIQDPLGRSRLKVEVETGAKKEMPGMPPAASSGGGCGDP